MMIVKKAALLLEIEPSGKAADEIRAIADELFAIPPENSYEFN